MKFEAGIHGMFGDEDAPEVKTEEDQKFAFEVVEARAKARIRGESPEQAEWNMFGLDLVVEE